MVSFSACRREHGVHLRSSKVAVSRPLALPLGTDAAKRFNRCRRTIAVIWKMLVVGQKRFRRPHDSRMLAKVVARVRSLDRAELPHDASA